MKVTVVGCGLMGGKLTKCLLDANNQVKVVDSNPDVVKKFPEGVIEYHSRIDDALDSDLIIFNLPTHSIVRIILDACAENVFNGKKVINTTTSTPEEVKDFEKFVTSQGGQYLDAKILCYPEDVGPETGLLVYSGDEAVFEYAKETLKAFSPEPTYLGENVTASSIVDLGVVAELHVAIYCAMMDAVSLAVKHDLPVEILLDWVTKIWGLSGGTTRHIKETFSNGIPEEFPDATGAFLSTECNSTHLVVTAMTESNINPTFSTSMATLLDAAVEKGYGRKELAALIKVVSEYK